MPAAQTQTDKQKLYQVTSEINALDKAKESLVKEIERLADEKRTVESETSALLESKQGLEKSLRELKDALISAEQALSDARDITIRERESVSQLKEKELGEIAKAKEEVAGLQALLFSNSKVADEREKKLKELDSDLRKQNEEIKELLKVLESEKQSLKEASSKAAKDMVEASAQKDQVKAELAALEVKRSEVNLLIEEARNTRGQADEEMKRKVALELEVQALNSQIASKRAEESASWAELNVHQSHLKEKEKRLRNLKTTLFNIVALDFVKTEVGEKDFENIKVIEEQWK